MFLTKPILMYLDIEAPLLAFILLLLRKDERVRGHAFILYYLALHFIANSIAKYLMLNQVNNIRLYQLNAVLSLVILTPFYLCELKKLISTAKYQWLRKIAIGAILVQVPIVIFEDSSILNSLSLTFTSLCICSYSLLFYFQSLSKEEGINLQLSHSHRIITAFFLYYSTCFFIFIFFRLFTKTSVENFADIWAIHNFMFFISCCMFIIASKKMKECGQ